MRDNAMSKDWIDLEMILTLGFYKFEDKPDDKKKIKIFTNKMNKVTGIDRSPNGIDYRIGNYKSVDPEYSGKGLNGGGSKVPLFFKEYVLDDPSLKKLARIYSNFQNGLDANDIVSVDNSEPDKTRTKVVCTVVYNKSQKVRDDTLSRANGVCELCGCNAPFKTKEGLPYLEVHYVIPLSMNGTDDLTNTLALCPNCHRKMHYGADLTKEEKEKIEIKFKK